MAQEFHFVMIINLHALLSLAPDHYIKLSAELTVNSTQESSCVRITLAEDQFHNSEMSFMVILGSNNSAVTFKPGRTHVLVHIHDNDGKKNTYIQV